MSNKTPCTLTALLAVVSLGANASTTDVSLAGTLTPSACTPSLSMGGRVDYGDLSIPELPIDPEDPSHSTLPLRNLTLLVSCGAPTPLALVATGNRRDSNAAGEARTFGLGRTVGGEPIGFYTAGWSGGTVRLDNLPADTLYSTDKGQTWTPLTSALLKHLGDRPDTRFGFASTGSTSPTPAQHLSLELEVSGWVRNDTLHFDQSLMDGSLTVEVQYL
ncbi:DUF1120 domain-containing protein [Pseudomonas sp. GD03860]|uniref:DUF1120 domain-containing protein n=1 Tax=Pseudomonas TaxID=286 RepID=UPI00236395A7|nr:MULTISPECIES: DUF1120 domain-containing protein [Pseudomonas]MDD2060844.1 DUF1120 domain-containing protein [Pseudomonas putida]MDH0638326.1 DUF1120 domain-containing protein [Pseudomonas sp. GD03860]